MKISKSLNRKRKKGRDDKMVMEKITGKGIFSGWLVVFVLLIIWLKSIFIPLVFSICLLLGFLLIGYIIHVFETLRD
ncbi:hypothetical protein J4204_03010 [Candidatus Woesearchaeota archaeon]|nr:hypothetical protein [Candidatus Woesearchaeota archaeon]